MCAQVRYGRGLYSKEADANPFFDWLVGSRHFMRNMQRGGGAVGVRGMGDLSKKRNVDF